MESMTQTAQESRWKVLDVYKKANYFGTATKMMLKRKKFRILRFHGVYQVHGLQVGYL